MTDQTPTHPNSDTTTTTTDTIKSRLKASYDAIAPRYNAWTIQTRSREIRQEWLEKLLKQLQPNDTPSAAQTAAGKAAEAPAGGEDDARITILELGCGSGTHPGTATLLTASPLVHAIANDLSSTQIALAKENLAPFTTNTVSPPRVQFQEGDMMSLSFPPSSLNAVVGLYSVIHLPRSEQAVLLERVHGWLKPGGFLLANFAAEEEEEVTMEEWLGEKEGWMYWSAWGKEKVVEIVKGVGFGIVESKLEEDVVDAEFLWVLARK